MYNKKIVQSITEDVLNQLYWAYDNYEEHPSLEHSFAVLEEEFLELRNEIFASRTFGRVPRNIYTEATQVASSAIRLLAEMYRRTPEDSKLEIVHLDIKPKAKRRHV